MNEKIKMLIERADEGVESAKLLLDKEFYDASVSRSYYAMFYATEAVLLTRNLKFSSHKGVISLFGQHFVKTGIFLPELSRDLAKALDERLSGDYSFESKITYKVAENALIRAKNFIQMIKIHLVKEKFLKK